MDADSQIIFSEGATLADESGNNSILPDTRLLKNASEDNLLDWSGTKVELTEGALIPTGKAIEFDNGSSVQKGYTDSNTGGNKGLSLVCSLQYDFHWDGGILFIREPDRFTVRKVAFARLAPDTSRDASEGFVIGNLWELDNGDVYECTDTTNDAAVWVLQSVSSSGHTIQNEGTPLTAQPNLNFIGSAVNVTNNSGDNSTDVIINLPATGVGIVMGLRNSSGSPSTSIDMGLR
jgi:hypothetical protein